jgi:hypothetical protein
MDQPLALLGCYDLYCRFGETSASAAALGMTSRNFAKLLKDCGLVGKALTLTAVDLAFTKAKASVQSGAHDWSSKRLSYDNFLAALELCADEAMITIDALHAAIVAHADGPLVACTIAAPSRFHDDKTTYTANLRGSHKPLSRRDSAPGLPAPAPPLDRAGLEAVYTSFARFGESQATATTAPGLTNRNLVKLFRDCGLEGGVVTPTVLDLAFARAARLPTSALAFGAANRLSFDAFLVALQIVAETDGAPDAPALHARIIAEGGPSVTAVTFARPNKFHDLAAVPRALAQLASASRASRAALEITSLPMPTVPANSLEVAKVFKWYCRFGETSATGGYAPGLSNRNLVKLFRDARLDGRDGCSSQTVDTLFAKARLAPPCVEGGAKRLSYEQFLVLLELVADETGASIDALHAAVGAIAHSGGPLVRATIAEPNRFHDDRSTYTANLRGGVAPRPPSSPHQPPVSLPADARVHEAFAAYASFGEVQAAAGALALSSRSWVKLFKDCALLSARLTPQVLDVAFAKARNAPETAGGVGASGGGKSTKLSYAQFAHAVNLCALELGEPVDALLAAIGERGAAGPVVNATVAQATKFHDDPRLFTANAASLRSDGAERRLGRELAGTPPRRPSLGAAGVAVVAASAFARSASPFHGGRAGSASRSRPDPRPWAASGATQSRHSAGSTLDVGFSNMRVV